MIRTPVVVCSLKPGGLHGSCRMPVGVGRSRPSEGGSPVHPLQVGQLPVPLKVFLSSGAGGRMQGTPCLFSPGNNICPSASQEGRKTPKQILFVAPSLPFPGQGEWVGEENMSFLSSPPGTQLKRCGHWCKCVQCSVWLRGPTPGCNPPPSSLRETLVLRLPPANGCGPWVQRAGAQCPLSSPPALGTTGQASVCPFSRFSGIQSLTAS